MKLALANFCLLLLGFAVGDRELWEVWKWKHDKVYNSVDDNAARYAIWQSRVDQMHEHNLRYDLGLESWQRGVNKFTDRTDHELTGKCSSLDEVEAISFPSDIHIESGSEGVPDSIDWRKRGAVTSVKDQSPIGTECGSCYTFAAAGTLEARWKFKTGRLVDLSEQQLVSCSQVAGNLGCDGGNVYRCYAYLKTHKLEAETTFPYVAAVTRCAHREYRGILNTNETMYRNIRGHEKSLMALVSRRGPAAVSIDARPDLSSYKSGIYASSRCQNEKLNHAVLVVGYGTSARGDYWIVKNSWGPDYGIDGYVHFARNAGNMCGIANSCSVPAVA